MSVEGAWSAEAAVVKGQEDALIHTSLVARREGARVGGTRECGVFVHDETDLDQRNIFHNALSWFFTDDAGTLGTWGVETYHPRILRTGSASFRNAAVPALGRSS